MRVTVILFPLLALAAPERPELRITQEAGARRVEILSAGQPVLASPPEGLWSIACDWREGWPADWHHANPSEQVSAGGWTILKDEVNACGGAWLIEDAYRSQGRALKGVRRFTWKGSRLAPKVTLSVRFGCEDRSVESRQGTLCRVRRHK
jgi:hypothetical protein